MITAETKEKLMKCAISTPERLSKDESTALLMKAACVEMLSDAGAITPEEKSELLEPIAKDMLMVLVKAMFKDEEK